MRRKPLSQSSRQSKILEGGSSGGGLAGLKGFTGGRKTLFPKKRPDILKLKEKSRPLPTKTDAKKMIAANKKTTRPKKKNVAGRTGIVKKTKYAVGAASLVGAGAGANQWINQGPEKKKKK